MLVAALGVHRCRVGDKPGGRGRQRARAGVQVRAGLIGGQVRHARQRGGRGLARESPRTARGVALTRVWVGSLDEIEATDGQPVRLAGDAEAAELGLGLGLDWG